MRKASPPPHPDALLELMDLLAEGLLGYEQPAGCLGEVEFFGDGHERSEMPQLDSHWVVVHGIPLSTSFRRETHA